MQCEQPSGRASHLILRTLQRSHAWPVLVYDCSLLFTTLEKSLGAPPLLSRGSLHLATPSGDSMSGSPGRLGGRPGAMAGGRIVGEGEGRRSAVGEGAAGNPY